VEAPEDDCVFGRKATVARNDARAPGKTRIRRGIREWQDDRKTRRECGYMKKLPPSHAAGDCIPTGSWMRERFAIDGPFQNTLEGYSKNSAWLVR
jgi:hypothetical protein